MTTAALTFYWSRDPASRKARWVLYDRPPGVSRWPVGACFCCTDGDRLAWRAYIHGGGGRAFESLEAVRGTSRAARDALEKLIDQRSIGLFGVDDVAFVTL